MTLTYPLDAWERYFKGTQSMSLRTSAWEGQVVVGTMTLFRRTCYQTSTRVVTTRA